MMIGKRHTNCKIPVALALAGSLITTGCQLRSASPAERTGHDRANIISETIEEYKRKIEEYKRKFQQSEQAYAASQDSMATDSSLAAKKVLDRLHELRARLAAVM